MNLKPAYDYLNRPHRIELRIRRLMYRREALMTCLLPKALTPKAVQVQEPTPGDKLGDVLADVEIIDQQVADLLAEKAEAIRSITQTIEKLDREEEKIVLIGFFLTRRKMADMAEELHYSVPGLYSMRRRGMTKLMPLIKSE